MSNFPSSIYDASGAALHAQEDPPINKERLIMPGPPTLLTTPLSSMQRAILAALPPEHECAVGTGHVLRAIGIERPTMAQRASITRSLTRLASRNLAVCYVPQPCRQGRGYLWGLP